MTAQGRAARWRPARARAALRLVWRYGPEPERRGSQMKRGLLVGVGALIALAGIIFTLQGVGAIGGSAMSGNTFWAVAGPVIVLAGLALAAVGIRRRSAS
jgi:hypothetical protein